MPLPGVSDRDRNLDITVLRGLEAQVTDYGIPTVISPHDGHKPFAMRVVGSAEAASGTLGDPAAGTVESGVQGIR